MAANAGMVMHHNDVHPVIKLHTKSIEIQIYFYDSIKIIIEKLFSVLN